MKIIAAIAFTATLVFSGSSWAAAPWLNVRQVITVDAPASEVWKTVKDFDALNTWLPPVAKDELVEGKNDTVGAVRLLTLKDGGTVKEKLLAFDPTHHTFRYTILESVLPVSDYTSRLTVASAGKGKASVTWTGHFKRKNVGDNPADNENDKTAVDTITGVYQAGLGNLKKMLEAR